MTVYMLIGMPGIGKSTWAKGFKSEETTIVSSDAIRKELFGDEACQQKGALVFNTFYNKAKEALDAGIPNIILDATFMNKSARSKALKAIGLPRADVNLVAVDFYCGVDLNLERALIQNSRRKRVVPEAVIYKMAKSYSQPSMKEGFNEIRSLI